MAACDGPGHIGKQAERDDAETVKFSKLMGETVFPEVSDMQGLQQLINSQG